MRNFENYPYFIQSIIFSIYAVKNILFRVLEIVQNIKKNLQERSIKKVLNYVTFESTI